MHNSFRIKAVQKMMGKSFFLSNYIKKIQVQLIKYFLKINSDKKIKFLKFQIRGRIFRRPVRILLTRYGGLGDILLTTPAIKALKKMYPRAFITFDTSQKGKELLDGNQDIDRITVNSADFVNEDFDWHIHWTYEYFPNLHIVDAYLKSIGAKISDKSNQKKYTLILSESDKIFANQFIESSGIYQHDLVMGVHAQAGYEQRRWPLENYLQILDYMEEKYNAKIIEFGTNDQPKIDKGLSLVGKSTLKQSAAVLMKCSFLLCNDSLMLHIACALDIPVVAIFGPAPPRTRLLANNVNYCCYPKYGCRGCVLYQKDLNKFGMACDKPFPECMYAVKPVEVINVIEKLLLNIGIKQPETKSLRQAL